MTEESGPQQDGQQPQEPSKPSWYKRRSTWIVAAVVVVLAIIGGAIGGEDDEDGSVAEDQSGAATSDVAAPADPDEDSGDEGKGGGKGYHMVEGSDDTMVLDGQIFPAVAMIYLNQRGIKVSDGAVLTDFGEQEACPALSADPTTKTLGETVESATAQLQSGDASFDGNAGREVTRASIAVACPEYLDLFFN